MNETRGEFLADAALAEQQDRRLAVGHAREIVHAGQKRRRFPHHPHGVAIRPGVGFQRIELFSQVALAIHAAQRMAADAGALGLVVGVEMRVQHLDRFTVLEQGLMRTLLAIFVAGARRVMRHHMAELADDGVGGDPVGGTVAPVGRHDALFAIDHHIRLVVGVDEFLQFKLGHGNLRTCHDAW